MRIYMAWFCSKNITIEKSALPNGCRFSKTPHEQFVFFEQANLGGYENLKTIFYSFAKLGLKCQSIHIYERGRMPNLTKYDFVEMSVGYSYPSNNITINAGPYTEEEWCYMIRGKRTIDIRALNVLPYFQDMARQLSLFDEGGQKRENTVFTRIS